MLLYRFYGGSDFCRFFGLWGSAEVQAKSHGRPKSHPRTTHEPLGPGATQEPPKSHLGCPGGAKGARGRPEGHPAGAKDAPGEVGEATEQHPMTQGSPPAPPCEIK